MKPGAARLWLFKPQTTVINKKTEPIRTKPIETGPTKIRRLLKSPFQVSSTDVTTPPPIRPGLNSRAIFEVMPSHRSLIADFDTRKNPRHTVLIPPDTPKEHVLDAIKQKLYLPRDFLRLDKQAIVILATPQHALWFNDHKFMADLIAVVKNSECAHLAKTSSFNVLAAVVDGLYPQLPSRKIRQGLSIQFGNVNQLLPGLWENTFQFNPDSEAESQLSVIFPRAAENKNVKLTLPLANTLFQTGRRSTLLVSEWKSTEGTSTFKLTRMAEKRTQIINLPQTTDEAHLGINSPLVPITHPRIISEALGNVISKIDIEGNPSPASKELQVNIPRLLETRKLNSPSEFIPGPISVWALTIPKDIVYGGSVADSRENLDEILARFYKANGFAFLGTAFGKLAFEMSNPHERIVWESKPMISNMLSRGARLHKILSGGGEWGAKAGLLSLDPHTNYDMQSEEQDLESFKRAFHGNSNAKGSIAKPGDFVQFFVERDPVSVTEQHGASNLERLENYPEVVFGVGNTTMKMGDLREVEPPESKGQVKFWFQHFGGFSTDGIHILNDEGLNTKLDTPGAMVSLSTLTKKPTNVFRGFRAVNLTKPSEEGLGA